MNVKELKEKLREGEVTFKYRKTNGEIRPARGTMCEALLPKAEPVRKFKCTHIVWDTEDVEGEIPKLPSRETLTIPVVELDGMDPGEVDEYICDMLTEKHNFLIKELAVDEVLDKPAKKMPEGSVFYFDLDKNEYRSFKAENLIED